MNHQLRQDLLTTGFSNTQINLISSFINELGLDASMLVNGVIDSVNNDEESIESIMLAITQLIRDKELENKENFDPNINRNGRGKQRTK